LIASISITSAGKPASSDLSVINKFHLVGYVIALVGMLAIPWIQYAKAKSPEYYFDNEPYEPEMEEETVQV
jgi:hypothetical protein